jgi:hypothetical protein
MLVVAFKIENVHKKKEIKFFLFQKKRQPSKTNVEHTTLEIGNFQSENSLN